MRRSKENGFTIAELLIALAVVGMIVGAAATLLSTSLQANATGESRCMLLREGNLAMDRMTRCVRRCTHLMIPNAHTDTRDILALSGFVNDDDDYYFNDPLFPKIDEDLSNDMNEDTKNGIEGIDEDGDNSVDEYNFPNSSTDDDEDGNADEDPLDGVDNDGDGCIDEDMGGDVTNDGAAGIRGMDDDGDGLVDEGSIYDDDEDGNLDEQGLIPVVYSFDSDTSTLTESFPATGETLVLSTHVSEFSVKLRQARIVQIKLKLVGTDNKTIQFEEYAFPRNLLQKTGKRVR